MTTLTIYSYPGNYRVNKALICAQYNNVKVDVPAGFELGKDNETKDFEAKFPNKKVPAMDTPFGPLYESGAIARYIARLRPDTGLLGIGFMGQALVDQWVDWCGFELEPARGAWLYPLWNIMPFKQHIYQAAKEEVHRCLRHLDSHLKSTTYLTGNTPTLADITVVAALADLVRMVLTEADTKKYENFARWFNTCTHQPQFSAVLGSVEFAQAEAHPGAGKPAAEHKADHGANGAEKKADGGKKDKKQKKGGEQQGAEKAAAAPAEAAAGGEKPKGDKGSKKEKGKKPEGGDQEKPKQQEKPKEGGGDKGSKKKGKGN